MSNSISVSIIIPVYNEETNIRPFFEALTAAIDGLSHTFEIIFVDDGSTDSSFRQMKELAEKDARVKILRFCRNFGSHPALSAGLRYASGEAMIMMSVDLQDPPNLIAPLLQRWKEGYYIVWGVRESREDPWLKKTLATLFYALIRRIALPTYPSQGIDFGLLDRKAVEVLNRSEESNRYIHSLLIWAGFPQSEIPYCRQERLSGRSKWSLAKRVKSAIDVIVSFSYFPIRFISYVGITVSFLSFLYAFELVMERVLFGKGIGGWPSLMVTILFLGGLQLTMMGVLGEYIWRGTDQVKKRPQYIVMNTVGFDGAGEKEEIRQPAAT